MKQQLLQFTGNLNNLVESKSVRNKKHSVKKQRSEMDKGFEDEIKEAITDLESSEHYVDNKVR